MLRIILLILFGLTFVRSSAVFNDPNTLDVASFNIQVFGLSKMENSLVRTTLVKIIRRYDLIVIQEIRDSSNKAIFDLLNLVNDGMPIGQRYAMDISKRLGRTMSKEQYAALYRVDWVKPISSYTYADPNDHFEREPHITIFNGLEHVGIQRFAIANIHTSPSEAQTEVDHLVDVYDDIKAKYNLEDVLIMGDFNADCAYIKDWAQVRLAADNRFYWLIDETIDTTSKRTDCTYDRIVAAGEKLMDALVPLSSAGFRFDKEYNLIKEATEKVSDHYPVSIQLQSKDEMNNNRDAFQTVTVRDSRVTRFIRKGGNVREIETLKSNLATMDRRFKVNTFYGNDGRKLKVIATRGNMKRTTLAKTLKKLKDNFPNIIRTSQYYKLKRLLKKTDPLRYIPRGHGRYQTSFDYYKTKDFKYAIAIECVFDNADCWITVKQELMD